MADNAQRVSEVAEGDWGEAESPKPDTHLLSECDSTEPAKSRREFRTPLISFPLLPSIFQDNFSIFEQNSELFLTNPLLASFSVTIKPNSIVSNQPFIIGISKCFSHLSIKSSRFYKVFSK